MNLRGKTREEIELKLAYKSRSVLLDLIHSLVSVEVHLKPSEIAARAGINKRAVLRDIRDGKFGPYIARADNSLLVPDFGDFVRDCLNRLVPCGRSPKLGPRLVAAGSSTYYKDWEHSNTAGAAITVTVPLN